MNSIVDCRLYGLKELARRAGVASSDFAEWEVKSAEAGIRVTIPVASRSILFPFQENLAASFLKSSVFRGWHRPPPEAWREHVRNFYVPFCEKGGAETDPLFLMTSGQQVRCSVDLLGSISFTLGRYEELDRNGVDQHGRYLAANSLAYLDGALERPIVDEYGLAFELVLRDIAPDFRPVERHEHVLVSHDMDEIGIPFRMRRVAGHVVKRSRVSDAIRDALALVFSIAPADLKCAQLISDHALDHGLESAVYWKASGKTKYDSGYDLRDRRIRKVIRKMRERGVEQGIHPGYDTFEAPEMLAREVAICKKVLGSDTFGGRQHYLRWSPKSWIDWEGEGLRYDSSVGFAETVGFRAGTCYPYRPWLFSENREADLVELPLLVMDVTLLGYMGLDTDEAVSRTLEIAQRCFLVGGVFTLIWHNSNYFEKDSGSVYREIVGRLGERRRERWEELAVW